MKLTFTTGTSQYDFAIGKRNDVKINKTQRKEVKLEGRKIMIER